MENNGKWALVVHGGADARPESLRSADERSGQHRGVTAALDAGAAVLASGGRSLDAVQAAVCVLEDAVEFNAGRGAALTRGSYAELDAAIMDGRTRSAGAVAGLRHVKNPIELARAVMDRGEFVFLVGSDAEQFAQENGIAMVRPEYFVTQHQLDKLHAVLAGGAPPVVLSSKGGTVGAVALDREGDLAAATSTGGMANKRYGRVGDSPIVGAGTYAENGVGAVSATGWGEYFIRSVASYDLCARMKYSGADVVRAAEEVIERVSALGGFGGLIAVDSHGEIATPYSSARMAHGYIKEGCEPVIVLDGQTNSGKG